MSAIQNLLEILDLEKLEENLFRGRSPQVTWQRVFGGQVIGQALVAACRTVEVATRPPHSLHAYFLLAGDPKVPIVYEVERVRDGKSFTTRRVKAIQHGQPIFVMSVSFHRDEPGLAHQATMPAVPSPDELPSEAEIREKVLPMMPEPVRRYYESERPIELRPVEYDRYLGKKIEDGRFHVWIRATGKLPDEPAIHQRGLIFARDGTLVASVAQEGLVRERRHQAGGNPHPDR
jgi:acyl-CoA thioesterase-2